MTPLKTWQLLCLLALVIVAIVILMRYSRSVAQHGGLLRPLAAAVVSAPAKWVQE